MVRIEQIEQIRRRIDAGDCDWAIAQLRELVSREQVGPDVHRLLALALLKSGDPEAALIALRKARALGTTATTEVEFGRFLNREGYRRAALDCFLFAIDVDPENADALALACMNYAKFGQPQLAIEFGQKSLSARDKQGNAQPVEPVAKARPRPFDPTAPSQNVISYSLFGDDPYYWDCAIAAASMAYAMFPEWRCRFYCDGKVPERVRTTLLRLQAQLLVLPGVSENWKGLFWRFLAFDDPDVNVVMIRDVDSPFTVRERLAVEEWLDSDFPFHVIRDHYNHCEPIMAGLWGGWTRLLPPIAPMLGREMTATRNRFADQEFLRLHVWPRIRSATLVHDRYFRLGQTRLLPSRARDRDMHIGMAWPRPPRGA